MTTNEKEFSNLAPMRLPSAATSPPPSASAARNCNNNDVDGEDDSPSSPSPPLLLSPRTGSARWSATSSSSSCFSLFGQEEQDVVHVILTEAAMQPVVSSSSSFCCADLPSPVDATSRRLRTDANDEKYDNGDECDYVILECDKRKDPNANRGDHSINNCTNGHRLSNNQIKINSHALPLVLSLQQYPSSDDRWGIFSSVWDGGIALLAYLRHLEEQHQTLVAHSNYNVEKVFKQKSPVNNIAAVSENALRTTEAVLERRSPSSLSPSLFSSFWDGLSVLDLGSGTGVVGLGVAALSQGRAATILTDLPEAVPLLRENVHRNQHLLRPVDGSSNNNKKNKNDEDEEHSNHGLFRFRSGGVTEPLCLTPTVHELTWGQPVDGQWLQEHVLQRCSRRPACATSSTSSSSEANKNMPTSISSPTTSAATNGPGDRTRTSNGRKKKLLRQRQQQQRAERLRCQRIIITGADIVYRQSLFVPLLTTLGELDARLHQLAADLESVEMILACHSIRTHLIAFWECAQKHNFEVLLLALTQIPTEETTKMPAIAGESLCSTMIVHTISPSPRTNVPAVAVTPFQPPLKLPLMEKPRPYMIQEGCVWIVQIRKLPYAFAI